MKKIKKNAARFAASIMTAGLAMSYSTAITKAETTTIDKYNVRNITTGQVVQNMGLGWNLGNTFDAFGTWINGTKVSDYETAWGAPITTKAMIDGVRKAGFSSMRLPVAWSNLMASDYTINAGLLDRVEEVANYALDNNMYVIINIHYDGGWFSGFSTDYDTNIKKYTSVWTQITSRFAKYGDHLIFESLNEEGCFNDIWNRWGGTTGKDKAFGILNNINQKFVDIVRASGGNNAKRHLLIAGYATDIDLTCDPYYKMPTDPANRCAVSVHYYNPSPFAVLDADADWAKAQTTWGTASDLADLANYMNKMKTTFSDKGIPVIVGEYGVAQKNKTPEMVRLFLTSVAKEAYKNGLCPMLWDGPGPQNVVYNRTTCQMNDSELAAQYKAIPQTVTRVNQINYGDINKDKNVNALDLALMKKYLMAPNTTSDTKVMDVNGDGAVNAIDLAYLKKYLLGQITVFPVQA
ncbi:cellulase family glycosylhydrolase [Clostridium cellulovorans]|uniref:Glycoside hydrolase family 5 n=2 Tax=Clostridium cellulovorans TaxID=1493 RepID=D9SW41_CLOC7|nr:cellulase family glycosylhydrolase [Clostridium cellulovorans]ADL51185.1 glycoside hydrolase family 5 [Clostridium cellulovorans 743B]BAV13031.1 endoglucanase [Clostridium cellulovorans]